MLTGVIVPVTPVQFENVLFVIVFVGVVPPSVRLKPVMVEVPAALILEKLLFWTVVTEPVTELPLSVSKSTFPEAPVFVNPVTMELLETVLVPVAIAL